MTTTTLVRHNGKQSVVQQEPVALNFMALGQSLGYQPELLEIVRDQIVSDTSITDAQLCVFIQFMFRNEFDPLAKPALGWCYKIAGRLIIGPSIHGLVAKADKTGCFAGSTRKPEFTHDDRGELIDCTVFIQKWVPAARQFVEVSGTAIFAECQQPSSDRWKKAKKSQLAKCALAQAIRSNFAEVLVDMPEMVDEPIDETPLDPDAGQPSTVDFIDAIETEEVGESEAPELSELDVLKRTATDLLQQKTDGDVELVANILNGRVIEKMSGNALRAFIGDLEVV